MSQEGTPSTSSYPALAGYLLVGTATAGCYLPAPLSVRSAITVGAGLTPIAAVLVSMRINKISDRLPWLLIVLGMLQLTAVNVTWLVMVGLGGASTGDTPVTIALQLGGYVSVLAASVVIVLRHTSDNAGGVIDSALTGLGVAAPVWEFLMRPRLLGSDLPTGSQLVILAQLLILTAVLASLLRVFHTSGRGLTALLFLFFASAWTVAGSVLSAFDMSAEADRRTPFIGLCWALAYLSLAAGAIHPTAGHLTQPVRGWREQPPRARLLRLGFFLMVIPLVGGVPQLYGHEPDGLLLCLGPLLATPLVLTRIGLLMTQRARDQRDLAYQATHDELTGLPNRRRLFTLVSEACAQCDRGELESFAVLYCDLDNFKPINDDHGHDAGDEVLRVISQRLVAAVRATDVVGRLGGDEFLVLCPGTPHPEARTLRERVQATIADPVPWRGGVLQVSVTVGIATRRCFERHTADTTTGTADTTTGTADTTTGTADTTTDSADITTGESDTTDESDATNRANTAGTTTNRANTMSGCNDVANTTVDAILAAADRDMYARKPTRPARPRTSTPIRRS